MNDVRVRDVEVSKSLNTNKDSCIIISSSGMMNAGRVRHHLFNSIENGGSAWAIADDRDKWVSELDEA